MLKGRLSLHRSNGRHGEDVVRLGFIDTESGSQFLSADMDLLDYAKLMTRNTDAI